MARFWKTLVAILGGSAVGGALMVVLGVTLGGSSRHAITPQEQLQERLAPGSVTGPVFGDLDFALVLGGAAVGLLLLLGLVAWVLCGREAWFQEQVDELYRSTEVRLLGVPLASGVLGGGVYVIAELSFASQEYPANFDDLLPCMGGFAFLGLVGYAFLAGLAALVRRALAPPPAPPLDQSADLASK